MYRLALCLCLALSPALASTGCDEDGSSSPADTFGSDTASPPADAVGSDTDTASSGNYACGYLACGERQACASRGQGVCDGPAPDEHGKCAPHCTPFHCGGGVHCLCKEFWCENLPTGCTSCSCATAPDASCECDDADGHVRFSCRGA